MGIVGFEKPIVSDQEVEIIAQQYSSSLVKSVDYAGGIPNVTFIVRFESEDPIAIRICNLGYTHPNHLKFEVDVLLYLERTYFKWSPRLIPLICGTGWIGAWEKFPVIATKAIAGITCDQLYASPNLCVEIGKAIGEMRCLLSKYPGHIPPNEDFWTRAERVLNDLKNYVIQQSWNVDSSMVTSTFRRAKDIVCTKIYTDEVLHGDVWPSNVLAHDGRLSGIIDFDDLTVGPSILDLSIAIGEFGFDRKSDIFLDCNVSSMIQGYRQFMGPFSYEACSLILALIEASYCYWLATNAMHSAPYSETDIYYRRINYLQNPSERKQLEKKLLNAISNADK